MIPGVSDDSTDAGFLDVAANALAVVILATMMLLLVSAPLLLPGEPDVTELAPRIPRPAQVDNTSRPYYATFYITSEGVARIDFSQLVDDALEGRDSPQGELDLRPTRTQLRDVDEYRATYRPDHGALKAASETLAGEAGAARLAELAAELDARGMGATLLVYPDGMAEASRLYWALAETGLPLRSYFMDYSSGVGMRRSYSNFETPGVRD
ncbi:hypothetical protein P2H44_25275 [Albimonas sp. CAU 1670]|uniref:hypothetical protein n=1 Tax=Albimonas sp. CAU 1670 TaxID=3032599 RepID=UPI0023DAF0F5|nr:hypothetical protein [Albimonas sp. CAU 1670]MDF2235878.1 hypothetical protein [Albimonas sp. CAU 1670]